MKIFLLFTSLIFAAYLLGFIRKTDTGECMSRDFTTAIKGFSILTVVWAHTGARLGVGGIQFIAGIGVSLFLICSGYGLECSYQKNGLNRFLQKRIVKILVPFWIVELIGLLLSGELTLRSYMLDITFIERARGPAWYMQYIVICYVLFFVLKYLGTKLHFFKMHESVILIAVFAVWFVVETIYPIGPDDSLLRARQMMSFPCGILIGKYLSQVKTTIANKKIAFCISGGGYCIGVLSLAITQLEAIKSLPTLIVNFLGLGTCFLIAVSMLITFYACPVLISSRTLILIGTVSFEIYLVHAYTLAFVEGSIKALVMFVLTTAIGTMALHYLTGKISSSDRIRK